MKDSEMITQHQRLSAELKRLDHDLIVKDGGFAVVDTGLEEYSPLLCDEDMDWPFIWRVEAYIKGLKRGRKNA